MRPIWDARARGAALGRAVCIAVVLLPVAAQAAGSLTRPILGYVFEPSAKAIRPVAGVPGAAVLDEALPSASKLENTFVAPGRRFAIAEAPGDEAAALVDWSNPSSTTTSVDGALRGPTFAAFSPDSAAAVYFRDSGRIQVWRGLPASPSVAHTAEATDVRALAISDDGDVVAWSGAAGITLISNTESKLVASGDFSALAFLPGTHDVLAAEPAMNRIVRVSSEQSEFTEFAGAAQGLASPQLIAVSRDGKYVVVTGTQGVLILSTANAATASGVVSECRFTMAAELKGDSVFLLSDSDGGQWVLDMEGTEARLVLAGGIR